MMSLLLRLLATTTIVNKTRSIASPKKNTGFSLLWLSKISEHADAPFKKKIKYSKNIHDDDDDVSPSSSLCCYCNCKC